MRRRVVLRSPLGDALQFHRLIGREALHQLFEFELDLLGRSNAIDPTALLGKPAAVVMESESGSPRYLAGLVTRFGLSHEDDRQSFYKMRLRPWLWLATRRSDFRIFQDQTVPAILTAVLGRYGYPLEQKLSRSHRPWTYCVQYHESDFAFISRVCEHEGIYFWFRHEAEQHVLVFADDIASSHPPLPGGETVRYHPHEQSGMTGGLAPSERIHAWEQVEEVRAGHHYTGDYDFQKPRADLASLRQMPPGHDHDDFERYD